MQSPLSMGDALHPGAGRDAGRQRPDAGAAAAARPRLDAPARARRRRAPQQRAHGDRPLRHRGRPDRPRQRGEPRGGRAAPARCSTAPTRWPARSTSSRTSPGSATALRLHVRLRRLLQLERERAARHGDARRQRAGASRFSCRPDAEAYDDYRAGARGRERRHGRPSTRAAGSRTPTRSTTTSASTSRRFPDPFNAPYVRTSARHPDVGRERQQHQRERPRSR